VNSSFLVCTTFSTLPASRWQPICVAMRAWRVRQIRIKAPTRVRRAHLCGQGCTVCITGAVEHCSSTYISSFAAAAAAAVILQLLWCCCAWRWLYTTATTSCCGVCGWMAEPLKTWSPAVASGSRSTPCRARLGGMQRACLCCRPSSRKVHPVPRHAVVVGCCSLMLWGCYACCRAVLVLAVPHSYVWRLFQTT
jgi:hypothetical protein